MKIKLFFFSIKKDLLIEMLDQFKSRSSFEKLKITSEKEAWLDFCSSFIDTNEYDTSDLNRIFELYHESNLDGVLLIESFSFSTDRNQLPIEILKSLFNACRIYILLYFLYFFMFS